ncbi:hypothetical protein EYW45_10885 [Achromobacter sp. KS-M25]|nr:hypothetical protein [Achromobacter aestuarii]
MAPTHTRLRASIYIGSIKNGTSAFAICYSAPIAHDNPVDALPHRKHCFPLPSSLFPLPSSLFPLPSPLFPPPSLSTPHKAAPPAPPIFELLPSLNSSHL